MGSVCVVWCVCGLVCVCVVRLFVGVACVFGLFENSVFVASSLRPSLVLSIAQLYFSFSFSFSSRVWRKEVRRPLAVAALPSR